MGPHTGLRTWRWWPVRPAVGPVTWSARPDRAPAAVITGAASEAAVFAGIRAYERDLDRHLAEARARLCACEMSAVGRDEARQAEALVSALEALQARLRD